VLVGHQRGALGADRLPWLWGDEVGEQLVVLMLTAVWGRMAQ